MEANGVNENAWWTEPNNFEDPLVMFIDEGLEELIFGHGDLYLRRIEVHSNTLIQLERWFTPSGQTRVTVVGPFRVKQWLMDMIQKLGSQETYQQSQGQEMLQHVQNQPLSSADLEASFWVQISVMGLLFNILFVL
ncbi:KH-likey domain-containing protein 1 [Sigmodon hispidus]